MYTNVSVEKLRLRGPLGGNREKQQLAQSQGQGSADDAPHRCSGGTHFGADAFLAWWRCTGLRRGGVWLAADAHLPILKLDRILVSALPDPADVHRRAGFLRRPARAVRLPALAAELRAKLDRVAEKWWPCHPEYEEAQA